MHDWGRNLIALIFLGATGLFLLSLLFRTHLRHWRAVAAYLALCIALSTSLVGLGKKLTNVDCPSDLQQFNGQRPYVHLFSDKPDNLARGRCFPGGHSSGAFSLFALYFIFLIYQPRHARKVLLGVIALGLIYSLAQWARGAHFVSHDLWSAAIGWYISLGLYRLMLCRHSQPAAQRTS